MSVHNPVEYGLGQFDSRNLAATVPMRTRLWVRYLPLLLFQVYLTFSVLIFAFGPIQFRITNPIALYSYVIAGQILIFIGYKWGSSSPAYQYQGRFSAILLVKISILLTVAFLPPTLSVRNYANLSVTEAIADPSAGFQAKFDVADRTPWLSYPRTLLSPILALFMPLGILSWRKMTLFWRALWLIGVSGELLIAFFVGRAFGVFEVVLPFSLLVWLLLYKWRTQSFSAGIRKRNPVPIAYRLGAGIVVIAVLVLGFWYFSVSRESRALSRGGYPDGTTGWSVPLYGVRLSESTEFATYYIARYVSLGYFGLSGSLQLPFRWTYGLGSSEFLRRYAEMFNKSFAVIEQRTYPARLMDATGYGSRTYWHTVYSWLASDLTFPGALLFVGLMGFLLARVWSDVLYGENPFAIGFLAQLLLFFYYIPANAIRFGRPESAFAFWGLLTLWLLTRKRARSSNNASAGI